MCTLIQSFSWIIVLDALRKSIVQKTELLQFFLGSTTAILDYPLGQYDNIVELFESFKASPSLSKLVQQFKSYSI